MGNETTRPPTRGVFEPLFDGESYDNVLARSLNNVSDVFDKREGSIIFDALAPMSFEVAILYQYLDFLFASAYGDTANRHWLIQRAKERGIEPYPASPAVIVGIFNSPPSIDDRFSSKGVYYKVSKFIEEKDGVFRYELTAEEAGKAGNLKAGRLKPVETTASGLSISKIEYLAILGEDDEETEAFRQRYFETIRSNAYGGNIDDYKNKVSSIGGVGKVKVIPVWNGGGTVKVIITDSEFGEPTDELVAKVQEILDPVPFNQKGVGVAPIGHLVTVVGAKKVTVDVSCKLVLQDVKRKDFVVEKLKGEIEAYFKEKREKFGEMSLLKDRIYTENDIRLAKIMAMVLNTDFVLDYEDISFTNPDRINDRVFVLDDNEIPYIGKLNIEVV